MNKLMTFWEAKKGIDGLKRASSVQRIKFLLN
jgi:hypothetical protein